MKNKLMIDEQFLNSGLSDFISCQLNFDEIDQSETSRVFYQTNEMLSKLSQSFLKAGNIKDTFDTSRCMLNVYGQFLIIRSEKMDITFDWGIEHDYFYLDGCLFHADNLRYMTDEFYCSLLELKSTGEFQFRQNGRLKVAQKPYFENKSSTIFCLLRNYMLYQNEKMDGRDYQLAPNFDPGFISIKFPFDLGWDVINKDVGRAFKILYRMNYQLWKAHTMKK